LKMNMFDEARAVQSMITMCGATQSEIAKKLGVSQSYVANKLRLLKFSSEEQVLILELGLTERHARTLLRISDKRERISAIKNVADRRLSVAECEALVDFLHDGEAPRRIGRADELERINKFLETLGESVKTLRSLGICATIQRSYHGKKTFVTVCIDESA